MNHLIGCGGVGCWAAKGLSKMRKFLVPDDKLTLWDGDLVETHNIERQLFQVRDVGRFTKARCLRSTLVDYRDWVTVKGYFVNSDRFETNDLVFVAVDNLAARDRILYAADDAGARLVIGMANEITDSEAWVYYPRLDTGHPDKDPRVFYPKSSEEYDPTQSCSDDEHQEIFPQLALANMGAAWKGLHLWYMHFVWAMDNEVDRENLVHRVGSGVAGIGNAVFKVEGS